jgi:hypothetical protein
LLLPWGLHLWKPMDWFIEVWSSGRLYWSIRTLSTSVYGRNRKSCSRSVKVSWRWKCNNT